jgi:DNA polymerase-4
MTVVSRWIAHVDMDAFFVGVELLRRPELRGKPVVVATGTDPTARGVVMAASYEARKFGVHSALPLSIAHRRCPQAVLVPRDMDLYQDVSRKVMAILRRYSECVEVAGLDEAYLDLSESPVPKSECRRIKHDIKVQTGLVCSIGLAPNKLLAKIASDLDKPDGFRVLRPEEMLDAVGERPASLIPGVGPKTAERLSSMGISTVADLARTDPSALERAFGPRLGGALRARANGVDERGLQTRREPKSESRETTFATDVDDPAVLNETVERLVAGLCERLDRSGYAGRTVTLKIRLRPFRTHTRSRTLESPTRDAATVGAVARALLDGFEVDAPVRLLGVGLSSLRRDPAGSGSERGEDASEEAEDQPALELDLGA